jgi:hypothetical protein
MTAIKQEDSILGVETVRQVQRSAIDQIDRHSWEGIADTELFRHSATPMQDDNEGAPIDNGA